MVTRRAHARSLQAVVIALGAPLGWLALRVLVAGVSVRAELTGDPWLYLYILTGTAFAFGLFGYLLGRSEDRLVEANQELHDRSLTDDLTGLRNRRYFFARLEEEHASSERTHKPLAIVVVDLDHFKQINDRFGHPVGDDALVATAQALSSVTRHGETEARIGGEEFALLLPGSTGAQASDVAERVCQAIAKTKTPVPGHTRKVEFTASAGVASTSELPSASRRELFAAADEALLRAKRQGRNRTITAESRAEHPEPQSAPQLRAADPAE